MGFAGVVEATVITLLENQLWLWLDQCDEGKPRAGMAVLEGSDRVVPLLQYGVREGREARRAGDSFKGLSSKLQ